jgi:hypothetical protein
MSSPNMSHLSADTNTYVVTNLYFEETYAMKEFFMNVDNVPCTFLLNYNYLHQLWSLKKLGKRCPCRTGKDKLSRCHSLYLSSFLD